jgi:hypothetical protein
MAGCRAIPAKTAAGVEGVNEGRTTTAGGTIEYGHFSPTVRMDELWDESIIAMAQWCLPSLRQQIGTLASAAFAPRSGRANGRPKSISSEMASKRRTQPLWHAPLLKIRQHNHVLVIFN